MLESEARGPRKRSRRYDTSQTRLCPEWADLLRKMIFIRASRKPSRTGVPSRQDRWYLTSTAARKPSPRVLTALRKDDVVFGATAITLTRCCSEVIRESDGRAVRQGDGCLQGQGRLDASLRCRHGLYGGYGIVGGHLTLATGDGYHAIQRYRSDCGLYFGDGAMTSDRFTRR